MPSAGAARRLAGDVIILIGRFDAGRRLGEAAERRYREFAFYLALWFWKGIEVDALYRARALWFGEGSNEDCAATGP